MDDKAKKLAEARKALLAKRLKGNRKPAVKQENISVLGYDRPVPLSLAQQRFWITHQLDETKASHNIYQAWRVKGLVDYDALQWAFGRLVERQSILRTKITMLDGEPMQSTHPAAFFRFNLIRDVGENQLNGQLKNEFERPFDLEKDPLIRLSLIPLNSDSSEHVFILNVHHIIADEYSNGIVWSDLASFYAEALGQNQDQRVDLPVEFRDFSAWQTTWLGGDAGKKQLAYWEKQLAGEVTSLQLPYDKVRPSVATGRGQTRSRPLPVPLTQAVSALSKQTNATPFMVWMAIFQLLLFRYTQQNDIWVGTPIGNRQRKEVRNLVGLFLNTLVVRSQIDDGQSFSDLLKAVQQTLLNGFAHQDVPFDQVVNAVQPNRETGLTPLFQTMLVYGKKGAGPQFEGLAFEKIDYASDFAKLDLTLFISDGSAPKASIQYSTDLFEAETIDRMLGHLETLATAVVEDPTQPVGRFPLLTEPEREQILIDWNRLQPAPDTSDKLLHGLILAHGKANPNHPAVIAGDGRTLTYRELDLESAKLARHLQKLGVNGETNPFVGLMVERRAEMLIGILGILRAGGAYVPIDPGYPADRIKHILTDAKLDVLLTTGDYKLPDDVNQTIQQINLSEPLAELEPAELDQITPPTPDSLAYLIYTSGSTGKPKGVMVTHANIVHSTTVRYDFYPNAAEKFLLLSSFAFDSSMVGIFWTLCQGGTLVLPEEGMHQNVSWLCNTIEKEQVTHLLALPSLYQILLEESGPNQLESLNTVMVAGEACHAGLVKLHYRKYPDSSLYNEYGPTEGTVWSHAYRFPEDFVGPAVPIGKAIPNVTQFILDGSNQPVPIGVAGELVIGGAGITPGYLNRPELTAEKFVQLPHLTDDPDGRFYRTGDLVKWRADGNVIFLGRVDYQVKIRGFRIELGEIESALLAHPAVKGGAVKVVESTKSKVRSEKQIGAWFTADGPVDTASLKKWMADRLPNYMVPAVFSQIETIPLNANGKVNRGALPAPSWETSADTAEFVPPSSETEKALADIWQAVLGQEKISITSNFFDLGGHSLMAIKIFAQIEKRLGANLPLATMFQAPTIQGLAGRMARRAETETLAEKVLVPIQPKGNGEPIFFLHDGAGYIFQYEQLAKIIGNNRPVYGLIPPDWDGNKRPIGSLEQMADDYIEVIKSVQPTGPYSLSGFSIGGVLAYEIAVKLKAAGDTIGTLALIEPTPWNRELLIKQPEPVQANANGASSANGHEPSKEVGRMRRHLTNLSRLARSPKELATYVWDSAYGRGFRIYEAVSMPIYLSRIKNSIMAVPKNLRDYYYIHVVSLELLHGYVPSRFDGDVHLFVINRGPLIDPAIGWDKHNAGTTHVHVIDTNEHSKLMRQPHAHKVAEILRDVT